jgi:nickel transport protein
MAEKFYSGIRSFKKMLSLMAASVLLIGIVGSASAHSPVLWCYVENGRVHVEAFFSGGSKIQGAEIVVIDKNGKKLLEGRTNKEGLFDFAPPLQDDMTILLRVNEGHSAEFTLTKQDFLDADQENRGAAKEK